MVVRVTKSNGTISNRCIRQLAQECIEFVDWNVCDHVLREANVNRIRFPCVVRLTQRNDVISKATVSRHEGLVLVEAHAEFLTLYTDELSREHVVRHILTSSRPWIAPQAREGDVKERISMRRSDLRAVSQVLITGIDAVHTLVIVRREGKARSRVEGKCVCACHDLLYNMQGGLGHDVATHSDCV